MCHSNDSWFGYFGIAGGLTQALVDFCGSLLFCLHATLRPISLQHAARPKCLHLFEIQSKKKQKNRHRSLEQQASSPARSSPAGFLSALTQHLLTHTSLTKPSCYGVACPAKRHVSGSGSQIREHENKSFDPADFWKRFAPRESDT